MVRWVVPVVLCNMVRLVANEATAWFGVGWQYMQAQSKIKRHKSLCFIVLFLVLKVRLLGSH